jgi:hypothetical protein
MFKFLECGGSTAVESLTHDSEIEGSIPSTIGTGEGKVVKNVQYLYLLHGP